MTEWTRHVLKGLGAAALALAFWAAPQPAEAQFFGGYGPYYGGYGYGGGFGDGPRERYYDRMEERTDELEDEEGAYVTDSMEEYYDRMESRSDTLGYRGHGGFGGLYRDYGGYYDYDLF